MFTFSTFTHHYELESFRHIEPLSKDYSVTVNGVEVPVYTARISAMPFNTVWPGHQRYLDQTELASFINLISDEELHIEVKVTREFKNAFIKPYSKEIKVEAKGDTVCFTISKNGGYALCLDDMHRPLYIFNGKEVPMGDKEKITHYFGPGIHMPGKITLHSGDRVYLDKDALVYGCIFAKGQENIEIYGNGIFDDSNEERFALHCYEDYTNGNFKIYDCKNVTVRGVGFKNSAIWCLNVFHSSFVTFDAVNVFGQWRYNTDGLDIVNSHDITVKNSFIHSFDDTISIKGITRYNGESNYNMLIENCVIWCDWGKALTLGIETYAKEYKDIIFRNIDILRGGWSSCAVQNGNNAEIHDILFDNIRVEIESFYSKELYQENDSQTYDLFDTVYISHPFSVDNYPYDDQKWNIHAQPRKAPEEGLVHDVTASDIAVYFDTRIPMENGKYPVPILFDSCKENSTFYNIKMENFTINGKPVTADDIMLTVKNTEEYSINR